MIQIFVNQKYHKNGNWVNNVQVKEGNTREEAQALAMHEYHAFLATYAYGQDPEVDYASCSVELQSGTILIQEVDDRLAPPN